jgi:hypothetical protein
MFCQRYCVTVAVESKLYVVGYLLTFWYLIVGSSAVQG